MSYALYGEEGFESNTIGSSWTQSITDDFDWSIGSSNGTPSDNTGPSGASAGTYYAYTEASVPRLEGDEAVIEHAVSGDPFDLSGGKVVFKYHMYDAAVNVSMGSLCFDYYISDDWVGGWSRVGNQAWSGTGWIGSQAVFPVGTEKIRFRGVVKDWPGDVALDEIQVYYLNHASKVKKYNTTLIIDTALSKSLRIKR
jgi:hypothetical protein